MRWYKAAVDCRVLRTGDPYLIALYHFLLAQAKATQAPGGLAHSTRVRGVPVMLEPGQVAINTHRPPLGLTRQQFRTLLSRLHDLDRCTIVPKLGITVVHVWNPVDVQEARVRSNPVRNPAFNPVSNPAMSEPKNGLGPPGNPASNPVTNPAGNPGAAPSAHSPIRDSDPEDSRENLIPAFGGSGELVERGQAAIREAEHPLSRVLLKQKLESVAVKVLGRLWFATEVETLGEAVPVARQAGLDAFLAGWERYLQDRRQKGKDVRLRWFMEELDRWMPRHEVLGHATLRPHLADIVADGTITEAEAWEIQNGAPWVDRNDILAHIPARRGQAKP